MENDDDFLDAIEADNSSEPEPVKVEVVEPKVETPEAEPAKTPEPALELTELAPEQTKPTEGFVPLGAVLDERDKRKALEARLAQLEQQQAERQPSQRPDAYEDPEGAAAYDQAQTGSALYQLNLRYSERMANVEHGADTVKAAKDWGFAKCDADPYFNAKVAASEDPIGFVVAEYKRDEIASKVDMSEFEQFQAWKAAQSTIAQGGQPPPTKQPQAIPAPSLASAPSAGNILTEAVQSDAEIFDEAIPKR